MGKIHYESTPICESRRFPKLRRRDNYPYQIYAISPPYPIFAAGHGLLCGLCFLLVEDQRYTVVLRTRLSRLQPSTSNNPIFLSPSQFVLIGRSRAALYSNVEPESTPP